MTKLYSLIFVSFFSLSSCSLFSCSSFYAGSDIYENFEVYYNNYNREAFVSGYTWLDQNNYQITVPDTYQNSETNKIYTITSLGGVYGRGLSCPFYVDFFSYIPEDDATDIYGTPYEEGCESNYTNFTYYDFTLNIGANVKTIAVNRLVYVVERTNGNKDGYIFRIRVNIDVNNTTLYSEDGKVYRTKDSTLWPKIIYW